MSHVKDITDADFVEVATLTNSLSRREISELRAIAAELNRAALEKNSEYSQRKNYNHVVRKLLDENRISLEQINAINGIDGVNEHETISEQALERIILTLINNETFASDQRGRYD
jgi:hypothetical protein